MNAIPLTADVLSYEARQIQSGGGRRPLARGVGGPGLVKKLSLNHPDKGNAVLLRVLDRTTLEPIGRNQYGLLRSQRPSLVGEDLHNIAPNGAHMVLALYED